MTGHVHFAENVNLDEFGTGFTKDSRVAAMDLAREIFLLSAREVLRAMKYAFAVALCLAIGMSPDALAKSIPTCEDVESGVGF